jgi:ribosomal protein S18 acetylase RimI-like enzyme
VNSCNEDDIKIIYEIAKEAYKTTRFHSDLKIKTIVADELQGTWVKNCFYADSDNKKLADEIIVLKDIKDNNANKVFGFVAGEILRDEHFLNDAKIGNIIHIATHKDFRGKGIGSALILESARWFKQHGCSTVIVNTQAMNIPALKMYQKNGFKVENIIISFHKWR